MKLKFTYPKITETGDTPYSIMRGSIPFLIALLLFFNPFPHTTAIKEICFYLSFMFLIVLLYFRKADFSLQTPLSQPFLFFTLWCMFGLMFALNKQNSLHDVYAHLIKYIIIYYLLVNFLNTKKRFVYLIWSMIASTVIFSTSEMIQFYYIMGNIISAKLGVGHLTELPSNTIGIITVFGLLLSISLFSREQIFYRQVVLALCIFSTTLATLLTQTRGTLLAMVVSFIIIFPKNKKVLIFLFIFMFVAAALLPIKNTLKKEEILKKVTGDYRIKIALLFIEMTKDYPVIGIGFGMQSYYDKALLDKYNARVSTKYRQAVPVKAPHNFLLDVAVRTGLVGLGLFLYIFFSSIRMSWHVIRHAKDNFFSDWELCCMGALCAILIQGLFESTMSGPPAIVLYTILAMMTILWRLNTESETAPNGKQSVST